MNHMKTKLPTDPGALSLILYAFQFTPNRNMPTWNETQSKHFLKLYGRDKLSYIAKNIVNYFSEKDLNLSQVLPSMEASIKEKELLLNYALEGIQKTIPLETLSKQ
jgi:hypothetical protein